MLGRVMQAVIRRKKQDADTPFGHTAIDAKSAIQQAAANHAMRTKRPMKGVSSKSNVSPPGMVKHQAIMRRVPNDTLTETSKIGPPVQGVAAVKKKKLIKGI